MTRKYYKPVAAEHRQPPPNAITLSDAIRDYLADCRTYRHLADSTVRRYEVSLRQFARPLLAREKYVEVRYVPRGVGGVGDGDGSPVKQGVQLKAQPPVRV